MLAEHFDLVIVWETLDVDGVWGWDVIETEAEATGNAGRAAGTDTTYRRHITGPTTSEHNGFGGSGTGGSCTGRDIRQRRGANVLGA
jgi:hypothetical protein